MRLLWMHFEATRRKTLRERRLDGQRLGLRLAVHEAVVCIATPGRARERSCHPDVERVMQKQIGEDGTRPERSACARRSRISIPRLN